jgi:hypothetical protein
VYDGGLMFLILQFFTAGILVLAANTAFQDFPRLASILANDRFMPSQFRNRGDRLVFSNGVIVLAIVAALLIWAFDAQLTRLIQLYVVGVFTAFTLSQTGMVRHWMRGRGPKWQRSAVINGIGAFTTGVVLIVVTITKFQKGAWIVIVAMPIIVLFFVSVHRHYDRIARILAAPRISGRSQPANRVVVLVEDLGPATSRAIAYMRAIRPATVDAVWVGDPSGFEDARERWGRRAARLGDLELLRGADRHLVRSVRRLVQERAGRPEDFLTVVIAEQVTAGFFRQALRGRRAFLLKTALLFMPGVVVTDVPHLAGDETDGQPERPVEPERSVVLVPVSGVHDGSVRAVLYARSLNPVAVEALYMQLDPADHGEELIREWHDREMDVPLVIVEAPFRDIGVPLLAEIRRHTVRGDTLVTVVLPELIPLHWWEGFLHNQTGLFVKEMLLTEPDVVLTSVPFHLRHPEIGATQDPPRGGA